MAYATQSNIGALSLVARFSEIRDQAIEAYKAWRVYHTTVTELSNLAPRDLADLGIAHTEIHAIAMEAAYGQQR